MKYFKFIILYVISVIATENSMAETIPDILGSPRVINPNLLNWPTDLTGGAPKLTDKNANTVMDLHASIKQCDMVLSTSGNYHMALRDLWYDHYLPKMQASGFPLRTWYYTTSPPISPAQIQKKRVTFSNVRGLCKPQVAVGPKAVMDQLAMDGVIDGSPIPIIRNRGNVLLVQAGNPKNIQGIWDLKRNDIRVATSNPVTEPGSFGNYSTSIFDIALNDSVPGSGAASELFNAIFNSTIKNKWVTGKRIHHRDVPWLVARNHADAAPIFYHLAVFAKMTFPDKFDIVPLGGTIDSPLPLPGNNIATMYAVKIIGNWTNRQIAAQNGLMKAFESASFTQLLTNYKLDRPATNATY